MPISVSPSISGLIGQSSPQYPLLLAEIHFASGTKYYSSGIAVNWGGKSFEGNRIKPTTVQTGILDHANNNFGSTTLTLCNLSDDGSANFPFQALDAAAPLQDRLVILYLYAPDAADGFEIWRGYTGAPKYNGSDKTVDLDLSFLFDSLNIPVPAATLPQAGFSTLDKTVNTDNNAAGSTIPLFYGAGEKRFRAVVYRSEVSGSYLYVNFIVSGTAAGKPFTHFGGSGTYDSGDLLHANLFGQVEAEIVNFRSDDVGSPVPKNVLRFPDLAVHPNVAYGFAAYKITDQIKNSLDNIQPDSVKVVMANGRPLIDTGLPSENFPLIIRDILRDPIYGLGMQLADFDDISDAENYCGTRYQARVALLQQTALEDTLQALLGECHCFMTWSGGKCQIRAKKNAGETIAATFATCDSGAAGRKVHGDKVDVEEKSFADTFNQVKYSYHKLSWGPARPVVLYDPVAQQYAGTGYNKVSEEAIDGIGLFDDEQVKISMAIRLREYLSGNLYVTMQVPMYEGVDIAPGDLIAVHSPDIFSSEDDIFRVVTKTYEFSDSSSPLTTFSLQIYKPGIYADNYDNLTVDLLRGLSGTNNAGRPPDVIPVDLERLDVSTDDTGGKMEHIQCDFTWPTYDPSTNTDNGVSTEDPRYACELWWHYQDESINAARLGAKVMYPDTSGVIQVDFVKDKVVEVFFVAISPSGGRGPLGYIPDVKHATSLSVNLGASDIAATVDDGSQLAGAAYVEIEKEFDKVDSVSGNTVNFTSADGARVPQFSSAAIAHPAGVQIAIAVPSYPSLTITLANPKFKYPIVTGVVARSRQEGVRVKWTDISADNLEQYLVYWSTDSDAATNIDKLGEDFPVWYNNDPEAPGTGVQIAFASGQSAFTIAYEDIAAAAGQPAGTVNIPIQIRVAARNGKRNYSSKLSALANSQATGTGGGAPVYAPTPPSAALITQLPIVDLHNKTVQIQFGPIFADDSNHAHTFADANSEWVDFQFHVSGQDTTKPIKKNYTVNDSSVTNVTATFEWPVGEDLFWDRNANANGNKNGKNFSVDNPTEFVAGNFSLNPALLASMSVTIFHTNPHHSDATVTIQQPGSGHPVLIKNLIARVIIPSSAGGDGLLKNIDKIPLGDDITWSTLGATNSHTFVIKHPAAAQGVTVQILVTAHGGLQRSVTLVLNATGDATADPFTANWIAGSAAATAAQAGLFVKSNEKKLKVHWATPQHLTGTPDAAPKSVTQYGLQISNLGGTMWLNLDSGPPYAEFNSIQEYMVVGNQMHEAFKASELPGEIVTSGFRIAVRAYNNQANGGFLPGPWTQLSTAIPFGGDLAPGDTVVPNAPPAPTITEYAGQLTVTADEATGSGSNTPMQWQVARWLGSLAAPTNADPPSGGIGAQKFKPQQNKSGVGTWAMPDSYQNSGLVATVAAAVRCRNKMVRTGGLSGAGWSPWSAVATLAGQGTSSIIGAGTDPNAPQLATNDGSGNWTNAAQGYSTVSNVNINSPIPGDLEPMRVWVNGDTGQVVVEFILPTISAGNSYTLKAIIYEFYKSTTGVLRVSTTYVPGPVASLALNPFQTASGAFRYRLLTQYRAQGSNDSAKGLSNWSNYVLIPPQSAPPTYNPGINPPPDTDFQGIGLRPTGGYLL